MRSAWLVGVSIAVAGCASDPAEEAAWTDGKADGASAVGIAATHLAVDLAVRTGVATLELESDGNVELDAAGLSIERVSDDTGERTHAIVDGKLRVATVKGPLVIAYGFDERPNMGYFLDGLLVNGSTVTYPYFCGNLFPCHSHPSDGTRFTLTLDGVPSGATAVYPAEIATDAPSSQLAWAIGDYTKRHLGTTAAGTSLSVYWLPGNHLAQINGTEHLVAAFDWLERTIGPYPYGTDVATVDVGWRTGHPGSRGHHPYFHVSSVSFGNERTHLAAAAAGWFGDAIRPRCWEDLVLVHGTTSYLVARAIGKVIGAAAEEEVWDDYKSHLIGSAAGDGAPAWPTGCNVTDPLWGRMLLDQGAFFYKAVAAEVGADQLDAVLAKFYQANVGRAAGMQDMLDLIEAETGFDPAQLAQRHLRVRSTL